MKIQVGDLVKAKGADEYGIIVNIIEFHSHASLYYQVHWNDGTFSGLYGAGLEVICK